MQPIVLEANGDLLPDCEHLPRPRSRVYLHVYVCFHTVVLCIARSSCICVRVLPRWRRTILVPFSCACVHSHRCAMHRAIVVPLLYEFCVFFVYLCVHTNALCVARSSYVCPYAHVLMWPLYVLTLVKREGQGVPHVGGSCVEHLLAQCLEWLLSEMLQT